VVLVSLGIHKFTGNSYLALTGAGLAATVAYTLVAVPPALLRRLAEMVKGRIRRTPASEVPA
jgi:hypothetical protein